MTAACRSALDRGLAAVLLLVLLPVLLTLTVIVRATSDGPVIFRQTRVGINGSRFTLFKFRTMTVDAEELLDRYRHGNDYDSVLFKLQEDPRTTTVGQFLRRWSLDELPQLWNVLAGQMRLVGPRPALPCEVECYDRDSALRLNVKPGMTGLVQVGGRADLAWEEAISMDLHYVSNRSLLLDAHILLLTPMAVFSGRGAY